MNQMKEREQRQTEANNLVDFGIRKKAAEKKSKKKDELDPNLENLNAHKDLWTAAVDIGKAVRSSGAGAGSLNEIWKEGVAGCRAKPAKRTQRANCS